MNYRNLGPTGLKVSTLCLGSNVFGWTCDEQASFAVLDAYAEAGGNFIDTANSYSTWVKGNSGGESETIIGKWLARRGNRGSMVIATKVGSRMGKRPNERGLSRAHIMASVEDSLRRLQTDYIDLYQAHYDDPTTPIEETMRAFDDLVRSGKVRYIGASNISAWRFARSLGISGTHGLARYVTLQPFYNAISREQFEKEMLPLCQEEGVGIIPYSAMADGFLSGKYRRGEPLPTTARAADVQSTYMTDRGWAVLDAHEAAAKALGVSVAAVATAWLAGRPAVVAPIASATNPAQVAELAAGADLELPPEHRQAIDEAGTP